MGINCVKLVLNDDTFISYNRDGHEGILSFSSLFPFWKYATVGDVEGCSAMTVGDDIIGFLLTASGQAGLIFIWDTLKRSVTHISDGAYAVSVVKHNNFVYSLCCVANYNTRAHFRLFKSEISDRIIGDTVPVLFHSECDIDDYNGDLSSISLASNGKNLSVILNNKIYSLSIL